MSSSLGLAARCIQNLQGAGCESNGGTKNPTELAFEAWLVVGLSVGLRQMKSLRENSKVFAGGRNVLRHFIIDLTVKGSLVRTFTPFYFLVEPVDILSVRGASVIMNCSAYCETSPKIEWKKDGTFLSLVSDDRRQLLPDGSLLINSVVHSKHNKPDEGYYQCVATVESLGTIVSRTAKLTVAGLPRFTSQPESSSAYKGNSAVLNCEVNVDLTPFVRWEQDRQPVFLDDRVFKLPSGALIISNATDSDGGLYRCVIESGGTPKYSEEAELKILPDPEVPQNVMFARQPSSLTKVTGQSAVLPCVAVGFPAPYIRWTRNEEELNTEG
ncbi:PREDICTED: neogenin, partial [Apaloderma vittatum]|uniref:neogenin n=1 Tax=Apaloderma vittatum TaxID=57397 RepID=UPI0005215FC3